MDKILFYRNCPKCNGEISYTNKKNRNQAERKKRSCVSCGGIEKSKKMTGVNNPFYGKKHSKELIEQIKENRLNSDKYIEYLSELKKNKEEKEILGKQLNPNGYERICPLCDSTIYHTKKENRNTAFNLKKPCKKCAMVKLNENMKGINNPFYGQKHTDNTKEKLKKSWTDERKSIQSDLLKNDEKKIELLKINGRINKEQYNTFYDNWVAKYGKEEADKKYEIYRQKISEKNSGSNNPMYGKPSPQGSGNGWSGWYK
jgi:hypothetical protein